jgi:basic membrane protein A
MKKLLSIILVLMLALTLLTSCGNNEGQQPVSEGKEASGEGIFPAIAKEDIKVGVIHIGNPADGSGYSYAHDQGIVAMQKALGLSDSQIIRKNNVNDTDPTATEAAMLECIEEGANIIFGTSWGYMDTMEALAQEYPDVLFSHGSGYKSNDRNFNNYFGRIYQARYLTGIAAGLKTKTNKLGYVAAMGKDNSEVTGGLNAFAMGAYSVNPDAKVYVKVTNSWYSPEEETNAAKALIAEGCDVIAQHCDTPNPQLEAEKAGVFGIGYNSDMSKDAPKATITSAVWNWGAYYTWAVENVINGTWKSENYYGGMKEGMVDISPINEGIAADAPAYSHGSKYNFSYIHTCIFGSRFAFTYHAYFISVFGIPKIYKYNENKNQSNNPSEMNTQYLVQLGVRSKSGNFGESRGTRVLPGTVSQVGNDV